MMIEMTGEDHTAQGEDHTAQGEDQEVRKDRGVREEEGVREEDREVLEGQGNILFYV